jgi:glycosyltransferase involved in cell wall biosynthesis
MKRLGVFVGEDENWTFFREIFDDLATCYETQVYAEKVHRTPLLYGRLNRWAYRRRIRALLRNDICFFEWASALLASASRMPKTCPVVARLHSFELHFWAHEIEWSNVDRIVFVSNASAARFVDLYPAQAGKATVVYNGVSLDRFRPGPRRFQWNLGMLAEVTPKKRIYEAVLTLHALRAQGYPARLHVGGGWTRSGLLRQYRDAIVSLVQRLGLREHVVLHGYVEDTPRWLRDIDVFVSNSYWEGQQVALIEAMASGCWCVSHAWPGAEEMLPAENLYESDADLAAKLIEYASRSDAERSVAQEGMRAIAERKFDIEKTKAGIRSVLEDTLAKS